MIDVVDFFTNNTTYSFKFKVKITGNTDGDVNAKDLPLKHLSNFWRTLEMQSITCEINIVLIWSANTGLPLIKNVFTSLAKSVLMRLRLTEAAADTVIQNTILGSGTTALIISNE